MARALTPTLLSLDRWARMLNLNPVHFNAAYGSTRWPLLGNCESLWPQHAWQGLDVVSREMVAEAIHDAEEDIMHAAGFSVAPQYFSAEPHPWPHRYDGARHTGFMQTKFSHLISPGRRGLTLIDADAVVAYTDFDVDGWKELATVTASTTITNPREIKLYFAGHSGDPEWEIRPLKSVTFAGGVVTIKADSWLFIKPSLWEEFPDGSKFDGIDINTDANFVTAVDVYREYVDSTQPSVQFWWANTDGCNDLLGITEQTGLFVIKDVMGGWLTPVAAEYDLTEAKWLGRDYDVCAEPDGAKLWYYAGDMDRRYLAGYTLDPLSEYWAQAIVWLSVARLELDPCDCTPSNLLFTEFRKDTATAKKGEATTIYMDQDTIGNPWGTRVGAVRAWNRVRKVLGDSVGGFVI